LEKIQFPELIRRWGALHRLPNVSWNAVSSMVKAAESHARENEAQLRKLLEASDRNLAPLCDPLCADAGLNRWLKGEREEAYSDWLAWILQQISQPERLLSLLQISDPDFAAQCEDQKVEVLREQVIPGGRLDVVLEFGAVALVVIEVKTTTAENAETAKQRRYREWCESRGVPYRLVLLCAEAEEEEYEGFIALSWADFCLEVRRLIRTLMGEIGLVKTAMIIGYIGAVENNVLHLVSPGAAGNGRAIFYGRTLDHVGQSLLRRENNE
jgi:hypothetical protein